MIKNISIFLAILSIVLLTTYRTDACYAYLSVEELSDKSDLIVIAKVNKNMGADDNEDTRVTNWQTIVLYTLKGEVNSSELIVSTPGVRSENMFATTDFFLDDWESDLLLLFLYKNNDKYMPLTPQGIVGLKSNIDQINVEANMTGKEFLKNFELDGTRLPDTEKSDLNKFINKSSFSIYTEEENYSIELNSNQKVKDLLKSKEIVYISITASSLIFIILLIKSKGK